MCTLVPAVRCAWDLDCDAFGDDDAGHTFTVAGVTFWLVKQDKDPPAGAYVVNAWWAARSEAIAIAINNATGPEITVKNDDGRVHLFGPVGMQVTSDAPGVVPVLIEAGSEARCDP